MWNIAMDWLWTVETSRDGSHQYLGTTTMHPMVVTVDATIIFT